ncbi:MAG: acyl-CoA dehydrogenase family protein [Zoogloeaceae bacterium]|jgi:alkylation response protein AidB-like acyl-CoA dehydrogenase|nr:acyl-CoA dehydrogenase family protein [Zoogloeaceae bacterium]
MTLSNPDTPLPVSTAGDSDDDRALLERFQPIFDRIAAGALQREKNRILPSEEVRWLREAGFGALRVPVAYGGSGATLPQLFRLLRLLGEADSNLPHIFRAQFSFIEGLLNDDNEANRQRWFPRAAAGDIVGAAMAERASTTGNNVKLTPVDEHTWRLDGEKFYSTGTLYANWISVAATDGTDRFSVIVSSTAPGVTRLDDWDGFGQRGSGSGTTRFENVIVEEQSLLRRFPIGEGRGDSYITAFYQEVHLATLAGITRAILRDAIAFTQSRTRTFGIPGESSPRHDPLVKRVIGRLSSLTYAAETLVDGVARVLENVWQAVQANRVKPEDYAYADIRAFQAQQILLDQVLEASSLLFEVGGASATSETRLFDRHWRNARTLASHNPASLRASYLGDFYLNGVVPSAGWSKRFAEKKASEETAQAEQTPSEADVGHFSIAPVAETEAKAA